MIKTERKACYLCTTPLQVFGAICLEMNLKQHADIFLFDDFNEYTELGRRLQETGIFQNVYYIDFHSSLSPGNGWHIRLQIIFRMITSDKYLYSIIGQRIAYKYVYNSTAAVSKSIVTNALCIWNKGIQIIRYDEGISSYTRSERGRKGSERFQIIKRILGWREIVDEASLVYLYQPNFCFQDAKEIRKMPFLSLNTEERTILRSVFCTKDNQSIEIKERAIIFDTYRKQTQQNETINTLDAIYGTIVEEIGRGNIVLKAHPRSTGTVEIDIPMFPYPNLPVETVYMQQSDLEDKILIAMNSTAIFTPKMLFNKEPRIVLLYRLVTHDPALRRKRDETYMNMLRMYSDQSRISIPETIDELRGILRQWSANDS